MQALSFSVGGWLGTISASSAINYTFTFTFLHFSEAGYAGRGGREASRLLMDGAWMSLEVVHLFSSTCGQRAGWLAGWLVDYGKWERGECEQVSTQKGGDATRPARKLTTRLARR